MEVCCKFCEEYYDVNELNDRIYPYEEGKYCNKCIGKLDKWNPDDWSKFLNELINTPPDNSWEYQQDYMRSKGYRTKKSAGAD